MNIRNIPSTQLSQQHGLQACAPFLGSQHTSRRCVVRHITTCARPEQPVRAAPQRRQRFETISLIAASCESNALLAKFEALAGRSAMIGFAIAVAAENLQPKQGLFGAWQGTDLRLYSSLALSLIICSALLATVSKRQLGLRLREAVFTSLTALAGSRGAVGNTPDVDEAVEYVFSKVFDWSMIWTMLEEDKYV